MAHNVRVLSAVLSFLVCQTISELRARGANVRHANGINTCVRCRTHYFHSLGGSADDCRAHAHELIAGRYPCCQAPAGTRGCQVAPHMPMYQCANGRVDQSKMIAHETGADVHVRRMNARGNNTAVASSQPSSSATAATPAQPLQSATKTSATPSPSVRAAGPTKVARPSAAPVHSIPQPLADLGTPVARTGDEIMVCGQLYHTGTPVILWGDVGGYDHYRVERRFCPIDQASYAVTQAEMPDIFTTPNRFGLRKNGLTSAEIESVRGGQWDLPTLQKQVRQFVLHFDQIGVSQQCFKVLQDERDLSIHFMLDIDGTIYQALDLKERAWQATIENTTSVGCEIANIGAYDPSGPTPFSQWYAKDADGNTIITIPAEYGDGGVHTANFVGSPDRPDPIQGVIQGQNLVQYDYTPQQYAALSKLLAAFCTIFPDVPCTYPTDANGDVVPQKLPDAELATYSGLLGHYHIQTNKIDPGPAMQWDKIVDTSKAIMKEAQLAKEAAMKTGSQATKTATPALHTAQSQPSAAADLQQRVSEWNLLRKMERKLLASAEESAARQFGAAAATTMASESDLFYFVDGAWWRSLQAWLDCPDATVRRPTAITNHNLLQPDERTPRTGLVQGRDYKTIHRLVWCEIVDLYGAGTPIVRPTCDLYQTARATPNLAGTPTAVTATPTTTPSPPSYATASSTAAVASAAPPMMMRAEEPWIFVDERD